MVTLDGSHLTFDQVRQVAVENEPVDLAPIALLAMQDSRAVVERLASGDQAVYGVNTGVGSTRGRPHLPNELEQLQRNIVRSHAVGVGPLARTARSFAP